MRLVSTAYHPVSGFTDPQLWLDRIDFYTCILEALAATGEVHSIEHIGIRTMLLQKGVHYHFRPLGAFSARFPLADHRFLRRLQPDAVLVHGVSVPLQLLQLRATLGSKVKILLWHRDEQPPNGWRAVLQRRASRVADGYLFTSPGNAAPWIEKGILEERKMHYLLHASSVFLPGDGTTIRAEFDLSDHPLFLWVGRLDANKDPLTVLSAFERVLQLHPGIRLAMAYGSGDLEETVRSRVAQSTLLKDAVILLGKVAHKDLQQWYRAADYFVSASHYEGGGIAFCEALSCGCVPVYSRIPSLAHLAGPWGVSFPPGDVPLLERALRTALLPEITNQRAAVIQRFQEHFSPGAIAAGLRNVLSSL
ncbi:MAG: glycosyltransferase [Chitinophagaceae bacterium]|nr:MAG: glycosyltransferase [Chitinophagaceae bacterium]